MARRPSLKEWLGLVKSAAKAWLDDYAPSMGAALSYYTVFSLAPLLLIVIGIAGLVFGEEAARGEIFAQLHGLMGEDAAKAVEGLLSSVNKPAQGIAATVFGLVLALVGATTVFGELQDALDRIWRAPARAQGGGLWGLLRARLLSFGMILGIAFLLMVSLVLGALIAALGKWWGGAFGDWEALLQIVNLLVGFALTTGVFAMIYKMMPRVQVRWHDVWLGSVVTALMFTLGKFLIGLYIGKSGVASGFGAAGSLVIVFIWVYYSAQIFLLGAEFTWVYAKTFGSLRDQVAAADTAPAPAVPSRSGDAEPDADPKARPGDRAAPTAPDGAVPGRPALTARTAEPPPTSEPAEPPSSWREVGIGVAAALALRYVVPRLLRRL